MRLLSGNPSPVQFVYFYVFFFSFTVMVKMTTNPNVAPKRNKIKAFNKYLFTPIFIMMKQKIYLYILDISILINNNENYNKLEFISLVIKYLTFFQIAIRVWLIILKSLSD